MDVTLNFRGSKTPCREKWSNYFFMVAEQNSGIMSNNFAIPEINQFVVILLGSSYPVCDISGQRLCASVQMLENPFESPRKVLKLLFPALSRLFFCVCDVLYRIGNGTSALHLQYKTSHKTII